MDIERKGSERGESENEYSLFQYIAITAGAGNIGANQFRPGNLPPKSEEEEKKIQSMVEKDRQEYLRIKKEKQKKMEKKRNDEKKKQAKIEKAIPIWEREIFPNWENLKRSKRVRELWIEGLPPSIRGKVWFLAFGNRSAITRDLFNIMAERGSKLKVLLKEHTSLEQQIIEEGGQIPVRSDQALLTPKKAISKSLKSSFAGDSSSAAAIKRVSKITINLSQSTADKPT